MAITVSTSENALGLRGVRVIPVKDCSTVGHQGEVMDCGKMYPQWRCNIVQE